MPNSRLSVLITRSPHQASELADRLRVLGAEPLLIPAIELTEPTSFHALDAALAHLDSFHWLLFTSANAVEAFHRRREFLQAGMPAKIIPKTTTQIAAIGPVTARALATIGLTPSLTPPQAIAESLTEALLPQARQPDGSPTRFLLVRAEEAREHLPEALRAAGAEVTVAPAYRNLIPQDSTSAIQQLFGASGSPPDAITFTSSSTVRNLLALCEAAGVVLPPKSLRISIGPITSQTLREAGLPPHAESPEASVASLAETVIKALQARPKLRAV